MALGEIKRKEKKGPDFKKIKISKNGLASVIFGLFALALVIVASVKTGTGTMEAPIAGYFGFAAALITVCGVVLSGYGFGEREVNFVLPIVGICVNAVLFIYLIYLYLYGLV